MSSKKLLSLVLAFSLVLISAMSFLFYLSNQLFIQQTGMVELAEEIKLQTTTAHLWLEELVGGDEYVPINSVLHYLDDADKFAVLMLEGGVYSNTKVYPFTDKEMRNSILIVRDKLSEFRHIAIKRYTNHIESAPGSALDITFDALFQNIIYLTSEVEHKIKKSIDEDFYEYKIISIILIILSVIISLILSMFLFRRENSRIELISSLSQANSVIEEKNKGLLKLAHYDQLTGLPNRGLFLTQLKQSIAQAERNATSIAVLFIDLDLFKQVNDTFGHQVGDLLLQEIAKRLSDTVRENDIVARISGDEFMVILNTLSDSLKTNNIAKIVSEHIRVALNKKFIFDENEVTISASIGVAIYPDDSLDCTELVQFADSAMYSAKDKGKNNIQFYSNV